MKRRAVRYLSTRGLGLLAIAAVMITVMVALGWWQYDAYAEHQRADAQAASEQPPVPLDEVLGRDEAFSGDAVGRPVEAIGSYLSAEQIYVTGFEGASRRYAVVTPFVTSSGSAILVVRGTSDELGADVPPGPFAIEGLLEPSMDEGSALDDDRVTDGIRTSSLVAAFDVDLYSGYIILTASTPSESLPAVEPPMSDPSRWAGIRNLIYALQWWLFAAFVAFMWWRIAQQDDEETPASVG